MADRLSNTQIDRLGRRLQSDPISDDDLRMLDEFRRTYAEAFGTVVRRLHELGFQPTCRSKTNDSIIGKMRRGDLKLLSQMQDVAGCRVIVPNVVDQDRTVIAVSSAFPGARIVDRRSNPRNGYRAVHVIPKTDGRTVEIQLRTELQHLWAELSEAYSLADPSIKYGGGSDDVRSMLSTSSETIASSERMSLPEYEKFRDDLAKSFQNAIVRVLQEQGAKRRAKE